MSYLQAQDDEIFLTHKNKKNSENKEKSVLSKQKCTPLVWFI